MDLDDLCCGSIGQAASAIEKKEISPVELTRAMLKRIERIDPLLHAFVHVNPTEALRAADAAQAQIVSGDYRGFLHGVPIGIKDVFDTATMPTSCGSPQLVGHTPERNAHVVDRLDAAGAIMLGKHATAEFAFIGYNKDYAPAPVNPWGFERAPGMSSGGSAVAVAASLSFGSFGTDTGGSIRCPSAWNGIVGLKPTFGRISRRGVLRFADSLDHVGPMARSVHDVVLLYRAVAGHDNDDPFSVDAKFDDPLPTLAGSIRGLRLGVDVRFYERFGEPEVVEATMAAVARLEQEGMEIVPVDLQALAEVCRHWLVVAGSEALHSRGRERFTKNTGLFGRNMRELLAIGMRTTADDLLQATFARRRADSVLDVALGRADYLVVPGMGSRVPPLAVMAAEPEIPPDAIPGAIVFTAPFNFSGHPTLSLPAGVDADATPLGVQFVARPFDESGLLKVGHASERTGPVLRRPREVHARSR